MEELLKGHIKQFGHWNVSSEIEYIDKFVDHQFDREIQGELLNQQIVSQYCYTHYNSTESLAPKHLIES